MFTMTFSKKKKNFINHPHWNYYIWLFHIISCVFQKKCDVTPSTLPTFTNFAVVSEEAIVLKDISDLQSAFLPVWPYLHLGFSIPKRTQIYFWRNWEGVFGNGHSLLCKGYSPWNIISCCDPRNLSVSILMIKR